MFKKLPLKNDRKSKMESIHEKQNATSQKKQQIVSNLENPKRRNSRNYSPEKNKQILKNNPNYKKILIACDLLEIKQSNCQRIEDDVADLEIYSQVLNERVTKKASKLDDKLNKKKAELNRSELNLVREQMELLLKEWEIKKSLNETLKKFKLKLFKELKTNLSNFDDNENDENREKATSKSCSKNESINRSPNESLNIPKTNTFMKALDKFKGFLSKRKAKEDEVDLVEKWGTVKRKMPEQDHNFGNDKDHEFSKNEGFQNELEISQPDKNGPIFKNNQRVKTYAIDPSTTPSNGKNLTNSKTQKVAESNLQQSRISIDPKLLPNVGKLPTRESINANKSNNARSPGKVIEKAKNKINGITTNTNFTQNDVNDSKTQPKTSEPTDKDSGYGTTRYMIKNSNDPVNTNFVINYQNVRQTSMKKDHREFDPLLDFVKLKKTTKNNSIFVILKLLKEKKLEDERKRKEFAFKQMEEEEEKQTAGSDISQSIIDEAKEDLRVKMIKKNNSDYKEGDEFKFKVVVPSFYPVKVSFKVGIKEENFGKQNVVLKKDRIFKNFHIHEIESHFSKNKLCGLRVLLKNDRNNFLLGGNFHGRIGDFMDVCRFEPNEGILKIEIGYDQKSIRSLGFITSLGRKHDVGMERQNAKTKKLEVISRYYPQELMLCKFFCQFNKATGYIDFFRFMFIRTVLY